MQSLRILAENSVSASSLAVDRLRIPTQRGKQTRIWPLRRESAIPTGSGSAWTPLVPADWAEGYCPICGDWPALAEARGLDGQRRLRCGRCGGDWRTEWLRCPFCGERGHENLGSLVSEGPEPQTVDVCQRCRHYIKALAGLVPIRPEHVFLQDLATLVLDVTALERGYRRPAATGREVEVIAKPSRLRTLFRLRQWTNGCGR